MEKIELEITANGMNGEGIARYNGKVVFVEGGVCGDKVIVKTEKENKNFINAKIINFVKKSEYRCTPVCEYYGACGGCNLQHINYERQLEIKTQNVQNLFDKQKLNVKVENCKSSIIQYGYRNKITLYFSKNRKLAFNEKKSNKLVEIDNCYLVDELFNNLIKKLNIFFNNNYEFNPLILKGIMIRKLENNLFILNLILTKKINLEKLENYLKLNKINYSLYYSLNNSNNNLLVSECYFVGGGKECFVEEFGIKYPVYPLSFLQVNQCVKNDIYNEILNLLNKSNNIIDAYSGAGLLSALIAKKSKKVFAVEIEKSASLACQELCKLNKIKNVISICGDCEKEVPKIIENNNIDVIVLDPARKGADEKTLNAILKSGAKSVIYLSCNPATLARDLKTLSEKYNISYAKCYDMFPNTSEVETLVYLCTKN